MTRTALFASLLLACAAPAAAAERNYSVTSFDRVRVEGPYRVRLSIGVAPFAKASGPASALDGVAIDVQGRTLVVRAQRASWGGFPGEAGGPVEIALGTHELSTAWINGAGSLSIDRVKGLTFELSLQGAGSADIGEALVDQLKVGISGSGSGRIAGVAPRLTALVRGTSSLDASGLAVKNATVGAEGPSVVKLAASETAKIDALGLASVEIAGSPACTVRAAGSASVTGCKAQGSR